MVCFVCLETGFHLAKQAENLGFFCFCLLVLGLNCHHEFLTKLANNINHSLLNMKYLTVLFWRAYMNNIFLIVS